MDVRILQPGDEALLEGFLLPQIESSMFLVGNMRLAGLVDNGRSYQGSYAAVFSGGAIVGVVALFWNGSLVLQSPEDYLRVLCETAVSAAHRPIQRVIGPKQQVQAVLDILSIAPDALQQDEPEYLYRLNLADLQLPAPLQSGTWRGRRAQGADIPLLTRWRVGYVMALLGEKDTPTLWKQTQTGIKQYIKLGHSWILEDDGVPVSTSSFNATVDELVQVGGVWTPPELRSRGYGRGAVAASLQAVREEGSHTAILFTGEENFPAQKAYTALGFQKIGDYRITTVKTR